MPEAGSSPDPGAIGEMFARIAPRYDLMNTLMSFGLDRGWRRRAVFEASPPPLGWALDVGAGSGALALELARAMPGGRVAAADFSQSMLAIAKQRLAAPPKANSISLQAADAMRLPYADSVFHCVVSGFLVRNVPDIERAFSEMARVTRLGGRVVCLELTPRTGRLSRLLLHFHYDWLIPWVGGLVTGEGSAYRYLVTSVKRFETPNELAGKMRAAGLVNVRWSRLGCGAVAVHVGEKPNLGPQTRPRPA